MARLGTLAIAAGTVLSAPFAVGTAFAAVTTVAPTNGAVTTTTNAGTFNPGPAPGTATVANINDPNPATVTVNGSAYFANPAPAGVVYSAGNQTATCAVGTNCNVAFNIGDTVAETVKVTVTPGPTDTASSANVTFTASPVTAVVTHGSVTDRNTAAAFAPYPATPGSLGQQANVALAGLVPGDSYTIQLSGGSAYFPTGVAGRTSATQITCGLAPAPACPANIPVGDGTADHATVTVTDNSTPANSAAAPFDVSFNALIFSTCGGRPTPPGVQGDNVTNVDPPYNACVSQAQYGTPVTETVKYVANGAGVGGQTLTATITSGAAQFTTGATNPPANTVAACTTAPDGTCNFTIVDNANPADAFFAFKVEATGATQGYPANFLATGGPAATAVPSMQVKLSTNAVTSSRVNLIAARTIAPTTQTAPNAPWAEPGDAIQLTYQLVGPCAAATTPAPGFTNCDNTAGATNLAVPLAGVSQEVKVDHGFFTPNCVFPQTTQGNPPPGAAYANCSFKTAPAAGGQVGDLTESGQTTTVTTDANGFFTVTIGIKGDSAFDNNGNVVAHVTSGGTAPLMVGALPNGVSCPAGGQAVQPHVNGPGSNRIVNAGTGATLVGGGQVGCQEDVVWTTRETPLNGSTAKFAVIPPLASPNNVSIASENNFDASDSGTINVPDQARVVFVIHAKDQFGNLTSDAGDTNMTLAKTGPGALRVCGLGAATSTDACVGGGGLVNTNPVTQPDGTVNQTINAGNVIASYLDLPAQFRYQADTSSSTGGAGNTGYGSTTPSVNDGITTMTLSWFPPTTTFKASPTPAAVTSTTAGVAQYVAGKAATAVTDTLTLNFYNQLSQPVVTFDVKPGNSVGTSTAVTVTATVLDQHGNPLVGQGIQVVRSGANEKSCTPIQNAANAVIFTNTSGVAGYTFSCDTPGASNVSMVVTGPGGIQLASGREVVTFTGQAIGGGLTKEKPTVRITAPKRHQLVIHAATHPSLSHVTVHFYKVKHGLKHLIGADKTGPAGHAHLKVKHLKSGSHPRYTARVVHLSDKYKSKYAKAHKHRVR
ncbi:MAG TPA: hypothetical protein VHB69_14280 [Mycobacteriales bacterium]|nr:hypothetical protein [Mycobacteriales bacterium]